MTEEVIGAAVEMLRAPIPAPLESAYGECLCREVTLGGIFLRPGETASGRIPGNQAGRQSSTNFKVPVLKNGIHGRIP